MFCLSPPAMNSRFYVLNICILTSPPILIAPSALMLLVISLPGPILVSWVGIPFLGTTLAAFQSWLDSASIYYSGLLQLTTLVASSACGSPQPQPERGRAVRR